MKGYKAFSYGMICRKGEYNEKQYAEHTTYEEQGGEICREGMMHFCANPLDCLDFYPLIDDDGNFVEIAEVDAEDPVTDDNKKYASKKLHIGARIDIKKLGSISAQVVRESVESETKGVKIGGYSAKQIGEDSAKQIGGYSAKQIGGYSAKQIGEDSANQIGGDAAKQVGGNYAKQVGGDAAKQVGGDAAKQVGGNYAKQIGEDSANQIGGDAAKQVGGNYAKQVGGDAAKQVGGKNSILVAGKNSIFKAGLHSVILHYWYDDDGDIGGFKAAQVDGINIKADTWYKLQDGEFVEVANETDMC